MALKNWRSAVTRISCISWNRHKYPAQLRHWKLEAINVPAVEEIWWLRPSKNLRHVLGERKNTWNHKGDPMNIKSLVKGWHGNKNINKWQDDLSIAYNLKWCSPLGLPKPFQYLLFLFNVFWSLLNLLKASWACPCKSKRHLPTFSHHFSTIHRLCVQKILDQ